MDYLNFKELCHTGIKGMKWGVRRFTNEDGSLTPEGKKRYAKELSDVRNQHNREEATRKATTTLKGNTKYAYSPLTKAQEGKEVAKKVREDNLNSTQSILSDSSRAVREASNMMKTGNGKSSHGDYSKLSDEYLRKQINRLSLEEQYARLTGDNKYVKSGSEVCREVLQTVGSVLSIAGAGVGIAYTVSKMKK